MTDDLMQFLHDRLDDDGQTAQAAGVRSTAWPVGGTLFLDGVEHNVIGDEEAFCHPHNAAHIARHDPARVLREVEAKRRTVTDLAATVAGDYIDDGEPVLAEHVLRLLALPFADHPDYREDWRP
jgi:hypothetical protein